MRRLVLYTRAGCHLCETARRKLEAIAADYPLSIEERDVDLEPEAAARFGGLVPVVLLDGQVAAAGRVSEYRLRRQLGVDPDPRRLLALARAALRRS